METKKLVMPFILMAILLVTIGAALGAAVNTINTPATSASVSGYYLVNATTNVTDPLNATFTAKCTDTANSTYTNINATIDNTTDAQTEFTSGWTSTGFEDSSSCTLIAKVCNSSNCINATSGTFSVDNTNPTSPSGLAPTTNIVYEKDNGDDVQFNVTVTGAQTTGCTLYWRGTSPSTAATHSMTHSGNTCTVTITDLNEGVFNWYVVATDGSDTAYSSDASLSIDKGGAGAGAKLLYTNMAEDGDSKGSASSVLLLVGALALVYYFSKKKPMRKRRK